MDYTFPLPKEDSSYNVGVKQTTPLVFVLMAACAHQGLDRGALVRALPDAPLREKRMIAGTLGARGGGAAFDALLREWDGLESAELREAGLSPEQAALKAAVAQALGRIGDRRAVRALRSGLNSRDPEVVRRSLLALGALRDRGAVGAVVRLLDSSHDGVSQAAHETLADLGGAAAREAFEIRLESKVPRTKALAACGLSRMGDKLGTLVLDGFIEETAEPCAEGVLAAACLARQGRRGALEYLLRSGEVETIGEVRRAAAAAGLERFAAAEDPGLRRRAAAALGSCGGRKAQRLLGRLRTDADWGVREAAREALARLGSYEP
jgi:HEAT repeat protein